MLKKCAILGLAVLLVGGVALGWLLRETQNEQAQTADLKAKHSIQPQEYLNKYGRWHLLSPDEQTRLALEMDKDRQGKTRQQLAQEQQARLRVDIEKLAAGEMSSGEIADFLYGPGWEQRVREYKKLQEQKEIAHTTSIVCISIGGTILSGCCVIWLLCGFVRLVRAIHAWWSRPAEEATDPPPAPELTDIPAHAPEEALAATQAGPRNKPRGLSPLSSPDHRSELGRPAVGDDGFLPRSLGTFATSRRPTLMVRKVPVEENPMDVLMSDGPSTQEWSPDAQWSTTIVHDSAREDTMSAPQFSDPPATATLEREERAPDLPHKLKEQAEDLQKQLAEFKEMAQSVQQATREQSTPLNTTLKELAEQVSAIRDYAASQQDRVEKLQDGYDWTIIRTFCLRVIRCLDNVERRINDLGEDDEATSHLEEIRDEMLFALESSGVERFEPEMHSEYRGQEKAAEAVKEKQASNKPGQAGKIAKVLRPGYRYITDDENYKVVRTAQVKLFG
ncbi:MAG: nucleotide exchange factor GrpE [Sedimentisphaerales bacterium]|nr:nucleotide exchange factor GrpE [Sedimentisphaerales bacterium]